MVVGQSEVVFEQSELVVVQPCNYSGKIVRCVDIRRVYVRCQMSQF